MAAPLQYKILRVNHTDAGEPDLAKRLERLNTLGADGYKLFTTVITDKGTIDTLAKPADAAEYPQA
jgi:hypothetical protein